MEVLYEDRLDGPEGLDDAQVDAAKTADTVGGFVADFRSKTRMLVEEGRVQQAEVDERMEVVEAGARGSHSLRLDDLESGVLGQAFVGAGDGGVRLSREVFANAEDRADVERAQHVAAHERAHGEQVQLRGTLVVDGEEIDPLLLLEGDAELAGNEAVGRGMDHHREGQPEAVYEEGQDVYVDLIRRLGKAKVRDVVRGHGDISVLQDPSEAAYALAA